MWRLVDREGYGTHPAIVVAGADWHAGIVGIVASRIADTYSRPSFIISLPSGDVPHGVGSGRSVPGFPLHKALEACSEFLIGHGGHAAAAGLRIFPKHIDAFRERLPALRRGPLSQRPTAATLDTRCGSSASAL